MSFQFLLATVLYPHIQLKETNNGQTEAELSTKVITFIHSAFSSQFTMTERQGDRYNAGSHTMHDSWEAFEENSMSIF